MSTRDRVLEVYHETGTILGTAKKLGVSRPTVRRWLRAMGAYSERPVLAGRINEREVETRPLPGHGEIKRYLLTSLQNNTKLHHRVWTNLLALAEHYNAEILVGTFSYDLSSYGKMSVKRGTVKGEAELWYDQRAEPFFMDRPVEIAPGLVWCGEMNILPTAVRPMQGLEVYTGRKSSIFPHAKVQMQSIPSAKGDPTKFNYTTGTVGKRNYIQKKAGLRAEFHHVYGALLVEVEHTGDWFVRQVSTGSSGVLHDLDVKVENGVATEGTRVKTVVWGDIHRATIDPTVCDLAWAPGGMLDVLQPEYQFMHDLLDFRARNGHTIKRGLIHDRFRAFTQGHDSVELEIMEVAEFLKETARDWCKTVVVDSNHDQFMMEWLRIGDYRDDPVNAIYFLEAQLHVYKAIASDPDAPVNLLRWAVERMSNPEIKRRVRFLDEDESLVILDIEHGMHGNLGPNGARGSTTNLARMGRKMNRGHEHSAGIFEGVYTAGLSGLLDQGYNKGPSSWSHSHILTYQNGHRAIITMHNGKWRAQSCTS